MKIYQVNIVCGKGSTGRIAADLSRLISSNGDSCRIAYGRGESPEDIDSFKISDKFDMYTHALMTRLTDRHGLYSTLSTKKLIADIEEYNPDIIHIHNIHGYYLNYRILFAFLEKYNKPIVWTMHDCWAFTGHCAHYESVNCDKWKTKCCQCSNLKGYPATWNGCNVEKNYNTKKEAFNKLHNMTIIAPSYWLAKQISDSFLNRYKCLTFHNGVDLEQFAPAVNNIKEKLNITDKKMLLGVTGTWTRNKGFYDFILLRKILDDKYIICLVGVTKKQIKSLPTGIIGITQLENTRELAKYYSAADYFLNLTYEDTFPTTNIESLACGTEVITYNTGGSPEIITSKCGYVVEKGDLNGIKKILENSEDVKAEYNQNCIDRAKKFEKDKCYNKYIELYNQMKTD